MTATEELRRMLDERWVKYRAIGDATFWETHDGAFRYKAKPHGEKLMVMTCCSQKDTVMTPEQVIAATLGAGECHNANNGLTFVCSECGANVDAASSIGYSYVDEFGKRWYGASNDYGLNYCPNCGRRVVDE